MLQTGREMEAERAELEAVIASGIFQRAPSLEQLLRYVADKYFQNETHLVKEYNIAVEALGRPADFDQKKDSIVRVEAHRLRKRLRQYYEADGAHHAIRIEIPSGQYAPQFVRVAGAIAVEAVAPPPNPEPLPDPAPAPSVVPPPPPALGDNQRRLWIGVGGLLLVILAGAGFWAAAERRTPPAETVSTSTLTATATAPGEAVRFLCGASSSYTDTAGNRWLTDRYFTGGEATAVAPRTIAGTKDPQLYFSRREGDFRYDIPLAPGHYELSLHFAEPLFGEGNMAGGGESSRIFNVRINGHESLMGYDVISDAGGAARANVRVFKDIQPAQDGQLHIVFESTRKEIAFVNAISVIPGIKGRMLPVRMVARDRAYKDTQGRAWTEDRHVAGGQFVARTEDISGGDPSLFRGERYGHFTYTIPAAPGGKYAVTLHFAEAWFGPTRPGGGGAGSRVFDVHCNGVALLKNFDLFREAGGSLKAVTRTFRGIEPNAQGKIILQFVPVRNYGLINAIEVVDESS